LNYTAVALSGLAYCQEGCRRKSCRRCDTCSRHRPSATNFAVLAERKDADPGAGARVNAVRALLYEVV